MEVDERELCSFEVSPAEVRPAQLCPAQLCPLQVRPAEIRFGEVRIQQVGVAEMRALQVGSPQIRRKLRFPLPALLDPLVPNVGPFLQGRQCSLRAIARPLSPICSPACLRVNCCLLAVGPNLVGQQTITRHCGKRLIYRLHAPSARGSSRHSDSRISIRD